MGASGCSSLLPDGPQQIRDHRKDLALQEAGYLVIRITWRQLEHEPLAVIAHIARALDRRARARG